MALQIHIYQSIYRVRRVVRWTVQELVKEVAMDWTMNDRFSEILHSAFLPVSFCRIEQSIRKIVTQVENAVFIFYSSHQKFPITKFTDEIFYISSGRFLIVLLLAKYSE